MKDTMRACYLVFDEESPESYASDVEVWWRGGLAQQHPLSQLAGGLDIRGEATAWGDTAHCTILDALSTTRPEDFDEVVRAVAALASPPELHDLQLESPIPTVLSIGFDSPELATLKAALVAATRPLITRSPLTDEEFQRALWWIDKGGCRASENRDTLFGAWEYYVRSGCPALPTSRHFRLGFLCRLYRRMVGAKNAGSCSSKDASALDRFLERGEPPWYAESGRFHTTLASGLPPEEDGDFRQRLADLRGRLHEELVMKLAGSRPQCIVLMAEDPSREVKVNFYDWLTQEYVEETRPALKAIESFPLATAGLDHRPNGLSRGV